MEQELKQFVLQALLRAKEPVQDRWLKDAIRSAFQHVTFTVGDLKQVIGECETAGWIAGTRDELLGVVWALTPKGKIKAQQL